MADDTTVSIDNDSNWVPPWATQPVTVGEAAALTPVPTPTDPSAPAQPPSSPPEIAMPDDFVGGAPDASAAAASSAPTAPPYASATGAPDAAPYASTSTTAPPPDLSAPPTPMPAGAPGLQNLGQPQPTAPPTQPGVTDNRLAGLLPPSQMHALGLATDKTVDPAVRAQAWNALPANVRTETMLHAQGDQLDSLGGIYEHLSPQEQVAWQIANNNSEQTKTNTAIAKATSDYQTKIEQNHQWEAQQRQVIAAKMDTNNARAQQLANTKVGVQFSPLSKVGIVLGSILGGVSGTNGSNSFMDSLNKNIDRQIAEQKYNLENQWKGLGESNNVLAQEWARTGDQAQAEYTYRQAAYGATLNTIKTEAQNYIPGGTTHAKLQAAYTQTLGQMQLAATAYQQQQEMGAAQLAKAKADAIGAGFEAQLKGLKVKKLSAGPAAPNTVTAAQVKQQFPQMAAVLGSMPDTTPIPLSQPFTGSEKNLDDISKSVKAQGEAQAARIKAQQDQQGTYIRGVDGQPVNDKSGQPVVAPSGTEAIELNKENANLQSAIDGAREMSRILRSEPSTIDREQWAKLKGLAGPFKAEVAGLLGAKFSSREEEAIEHISSLDFDSWKRSYGEVFKATQLDQFASGLSKLGEEKAKRIVGADGPWKKIILDPGELKPAQRTPEQDDIAKASEDVLRNQREQMTPDDKVWHDNYGVVQVGAPSYNKLSPLVQRGVETGVPPSQLQLFDKAYANATSSDPALAQKGAVFINTLADERGAKGAYAKGLQQQLISHNAGQAASAEDAE